MCIAYLQVAGFAVFLVPAQYFFNFHCRIVAEERALYIPYFTSFLRKSHMFVVTHNVVKHACSIIRWVLTCSWLQGTMLHGLLLFDMTRMTVRGFLRHSWWQLHCVPMNKAHTSCNSTRVLYVCEHYVFLHSTSHWKTVQCGWLSNMYVNTK